MKNVGSQSIITLFLEFAGTLARVFTTFAEVSDKLLLGSAIAAAALNGILMVQFFIYSKKSVKNKKKKQ